MAGHAHYHRIWALQKAAGSSPSIRYTGNRDRNLVRSRALSGEKVASRIRTPNSFIETTLAANTVDPKTYGRDDLSAPQAVQRGVFNPFVWRNLPLNFVE